MKADQARSSEMSFAGVGRIPETHKKTAPTGTTFRDKRHSTYRTNTAND